MRTVVDAITSAAGAAGTLTVTGPETLSLPWATVHDRARRMATVLAQHGIGPGSRVGLLADTSAGLVTAIQAVWLRGAAFTVLPLPTRAGQAAQLERLRAIVADAGYALVIADDIVGAAMPARTVSLSQLEEHAEHAHPAEPLRPGPDDLAILQYTSGSTRAPSAVAVTHGNLAANLDAIEAALGTAALDPRHASWLSWLPLYHDMGLIGFLALPMSRGCPLVLQSPLTFALRPASWLANIAAHRATATGAPNFAFGLLTSLLEKGTWDLASVRYLFSGGEPIDAAMMRRFATAGTPHGLDPQAIVPCYGLAESTLAVSFANIGEGIRVDEVDRDSLERHQTPLPAVAGLPSRQLVRLGPAVLGTQLRIVNDVGLEVAPRTVGHIEVRGPSVVGTGWLRTGDLGYLAEGDLVVCGRAKDVLFAAGRNVYPQDAEAAAAQVPGVRPGGAAAFGVPADVGDRLIVAVECRAPKGFDLAALRHAVALAVTGETGMKPAEVITIRPGHLPKTSSGKLRRAETRRRYLAGEFTSALGERSVQ